MYTVQHGVTAEG